MLLRRVLLEPCAEPPHPAGLRRTRPLRAICLALCLAHALIAQETYAAATVRRAIGPGVIYPAAEAALRAEIGSLFRQAEPPYQNARLAACIVPYSRYDYAGIVAAHAFKFLLPGQYDRVIVLGASLRTRFEGCSIASVAGYETPLGVVPIDLDAVKMLTRCPLIGARSVRYEAAKGRVQLHEREHSIEAVLPFLQERMGKFLLIPILVSDHNDAHGKTSEASYNVVAGAITRVMDENTLLVVSTEFTHFGNDFSFRPFNDHIAESIQRLDYQAFHLLVRRDFDAFRRYLEKTGNTISGKEALLLMMKLLPDHTTARVLAYQTSSGITGDTDRSVSYGAIGYYDPTRSPAGERFTATETAGQGATVLKMKGRYEEGLPSAAEISGNVPMPDASGAPSIVELSRSDSTILRMKGSADGNRPPIQEIIRPEDRAQREAPPETAPKPPAAPTQELDKDESNVLKMEESPKQDEPVLIRMKGSKDGSRPVQIEVQGTLPRTSEGTAEDEKGRVTWMSGPRAKTGEEMTPTSRKDADHDE